MDKIPEGCGDYAVAEFECLRRLKAVRDVLGGFVSGDWLLDVELLLLAAEVLDAAGAWALTAEEARVREAA
jgi:hypothetical protein